MSDAPAVCRFRASPWCFDIWQAAALLEAPARPQGKPAPGRNQESFRFGVPASLDFPASEVQDVCWNGGEFPAESSGAAQDGTRESKTVPVSPPDAKPRLDVNILGLAGTDGPLPPPITGVIRERLREGDTALQDFLNVFHNRLLRLWRENAVALCPELDADGSPEEQPFAVFLHAVAGVPQSGGRFCATPMAGPTHPCTGTVPDAVFRACAAVWAQQPRSAAGLEKLVRVAFGVPASVKPFRGVWMDLPEDARTRLGGGATENATLGDNALLGRRIFDGTAGVTLHIGPLSPERYRAFLPPPAGTRRGDLLALARWYLGDEVECALVLIPKRSENGT